MSTTSIDEYLRIIFFLGFSAEGNSASQFVRRAAVEDELRERLSALVAGILPEFETEYAPLAARLFDELLEVGVVEKIDDEFAGAYFKVRADVWQSHRSATLNSSEIYKKSKTIGPNFFSDALGNYANWHSPADFASAIGIVAPASDRIVSLTHNQIDEIDKPLTKFIEDLDHDNGIPEAPGVKERILGQIRAGRELILAGSFKAHILYVTLLSGLAELIKRYDGHVIGATAATLVELLIKHFSGTE